MDIINKKKFLICAVCAFIPIFCVKRTEYKPSSIASEDIKPPRLIQRIEPFYPPEARAKGQQGTVQLSLFITKEGMVQKVEIIRSSGYSILDQAAQDYALSLLFTPAERNNEPTTVWLSWTVNYNLILYKSSFNPENYVDQLYKLFTVAEKGNTQEKNAISSKILELHSQYINYIRENPRSNLYRYLKIFLSPQIFQQWQEFLIEWPLTFIVIQDLLKRFPDSEKIQDDKEILIILVKEDVKRVSMLTNVSTPRLLELRQKFFKALHEFLKNNYPDYFKGYLKEMLEKY